MDGGEVVSTSQNFVVSVDAAMRALAEAKTPGDLLKIANTAEALRVYARRAKLGLLAQNRAADIRLRAERRIGEFLAQSQRHVGGRPTNKPVPEENGFSPARLRELGIDRKLSSWAQRLWAIPPKLFDEFLADAHRTGWEINTRAMVHLCEHRLAVAKNQQRIVGGRVDDLVEFASAGNRMGCIYIDPPWHVPGAVLPYYSVSLEELRNLPIPELAAERCHLHFWTMANEYMFAARDIIHSWGFRVVSSFVWVKPSLGQGSYWRMSHEVMLTAVRGPEDRFDDSGLRSWIEAPRGRHSEKPEAVREMIERASPGPRLELFARKLTPGWFCWGHEIALSLESQTAQSGTVFL